MSVDGWLCLVRSPLLHKYLDGLWSEPRRHLGEEHSRQRKQPGCVPETRACLTHARSSKVASVAGRE